MSAAGSRFTNLSFGYRRGIPVFQDLTAEWAPGRTLLLGPNGAGKTTLFRILIGLQRPKAGTAEIYGSERKSGSQAWGWLPQHTSGVPGLKVAEQVAYCGWLSGMGERDARFAAPGALEQVDLQDRAKEAATSLSGGQLRRLGLACALVHDPELLLLDEPTAGLDPMQAKGFRELLAGLPSSVSVVASTHDIHDVQSVFDRVMVLNSGQVRFSGDMAEFVAIGDERGDLATAYQRAVTRSER